MREHPERPGLSYTDLRRLVVFAVFLVLAIWFILWLSVRIQEVLRLLAVSILLATALRPTVDQLSHYPLPLLRRPMRRPIAILLIYLTLALIVAGAAALVIPPLVAEGRRFIANAPRYVEGIERMLEGLRVYPFVPDVGNIFRELLGEVVNNVPQAMGILFFAINTLTGVLSIGVVLVLTFFLIMDADPIYNHFIILLQPDQRGRAREMTAKMGHRIEGWLKGAVLLSFSIGIPTGLVMWLIGMPYPLLLGVVAGFFEFIPMVGAYLGAAPAVLLALLQPTWMLVAVIAFFVVLQLTENNVLAPSIMGSAVEVPPLLVIVALLIGASLMGVLGALLAVPSAAVLHVLWTDLVVREIKRNTGETAQGN